MELEPGLVVVVTTVNIDTTTMVNRPPPRREKIYLAREMTFMEMGADLFFLSVLISV